MEKIWIAQPHGNDAQTATLAEQLGVDRLTAKLLIQRGIASAEAAKSFFHPSLDELHDPFLMKDMDAAVERLTNALHRKEKILVYGDYDVDGTTSVTMMFSFLRRLRAECDYYIPDRYKEGYGFSFAGVDHARASGCSLIITLDCGIRDGEKIAYAREHGIDVIVCDHHQPAEIPVAAAVLDPKRPDCAYPYKGLSGCGVGFKLLQGFCIQHSIEFGEIYAYLDLLAISIGADIVPLTGENRIMAFYGLKSLAEHRRPGVAAMLEKAGVKKKNLTITDVVFVLAPRINAAGRIFSGRQAVALLLTENQEEANALSPALEENNQTRKSLDKEITTEALQMVRDDLFYENSYTTVVTGPAWHKGVVGIVASRMVEAFYKPAIVLVHDGEKMSGSARSIDGVDLFEALGECSDLLQQFGGHTMAAGLTMKAENFHAFRSRFDAVVERLLESKRPLPFVAYDTEINFAEITPEFYHRLSLFAPFGPGNMKPVFRANGVSNAKFTRRVGETKTHLKLHVCQKNNAAVTMDGIAFDLGDWAEPLIAGEIVDVLFSLEENEWNNRVTIQLSVKDIKATTN